MVSTRSSHPNGDQNTNESYKDRHIKKVVNYEQDSSNDSFGNSKAPSRTRRILRKRTVPNYRNAFDYMDEDDDHDEPIGRRRRRDTRRNARTLIDRSNSGSPTTGRFPKKARSSNLSMYDRVKNRRKSMDPDVYSEEREENDNNEQQQEEHDQNNENDNERKTNNNNKNNEQTHQNGDGDTTEDNTMDVLHHDEEDEDEGEE
ncbi:unnamed protein product, partial [Rotaria socialis]